MRRNNFWCKQSANPGFSFYRAVEPSKPADDHDDLHVHFTKSVAEKASVVPGKPKIERRPTSGKGLLSLPLQDLLDDSDSDDGVLSVHSLASSSSFEVKPIPAVKDESSKKEPKKGIKFADADDKGAQSSDGEKKTEKGTGVKKSAASSAVKKPTKRTSSKFN